MEEKKILGVPFTTEAVTLLRAGDMCYISGTIYTARDTVHLRLVETLKRDEEIPFDSEGQVVYYAGPCPAKPEQPVDSVGPTTGGRMNTYSPALITYGLHVMTGKGLRSPKVAGTIKQYKGVYFAAIGGTTTLAGKCIKEAEVVTFDDLGPEAIRKLCIEESPVIAAVDSLGEDTYSLGRSQYARH